ncbi:uncharacterized protein K444DRAFT_669303 [Hyaloscypha bicolor E]|uniref:Uncharacterized protein n=1 Tax=Hyaloscypha bicolor E TaxID=1095630 RepID=A0A2J6SL70_9HELO|nr:uncharacterized protein K444DRAFT_669303 [Hyaloscypha bicolor E]PMD51523.1 hypothetical protein K444DRAFT_669303 [Hyaloscypha bicolor E]
MPYSRFAIFSSLVLFIICVCTPAAWPLIDQMPLGGSELEQWIPAFDNPTFLARNSTDNDFVKQFRNPKGIVAVLLLVGADVVQRAIAQSASRSEAHDVWSLSWLTPAVFSFGWVSYAVNSVATALVTTNSGDVRQNQSWVIGRLIRDLELQVEREVSETKLESGLIATVYKALPNVQHARYGMMKPDRTTVWIAFWVTVALQVVVAAAPYYYEKGTKSWAVLAVTGAGNILAVLTASVPRNKYPARSNSKSIYAITRGNGYRHVFIILPDTLRKVDGVPESSLPHLQDMASAIDRANLPTRGLICLLALAWAVLLLAVAGLTDDTWFLLLVGLMGMGNNIYISSRDCTPIEHGIPIEKFQLDGEPNPIGLRRPEDARPGVMENLFKIEKKYPGAGQSLLKLFFPDRLTDAEKDKWAGGEYSLVSMDSRLKD